MTSQEHDHALLASAALAALGLLGLGAYATLDIPHRWAMLLLAAASIGVVAAGLHISHSRHRDRHEEAMRMLRELRIGQLADDATRLSDGVVPLRRH